MKDFFTEIFTYHHHFNQLLADTFKIHEMELTERAVPLFSHMVNAHAIWISRIQNTPGPGVHEVHTVEKIKVLDFENFNTTRELLKEVDFDVLINYQNSQGQSFTNSVRDILFHVANHHTHHRAQLMSDMRQCGIQPLRTDFIFYKR